MSERTTVAVLLDGVNRLLWWTAFAFFCVVRLLLLCFVFSRPISPAWAVGAVEVLALYWGVLNARVAVRRCYSALGLWPPVAYALGLLLLPSGSAPLQGWGFATAGLVLTSWALFSLRQRFSVGPTCWVGLCDWGPYRWVRHPQLLARCLMVLGVYCSSTGLVDAVCCGLALVLTASVVWTEEAELRKEPDYQAYVERVPWAVLPGVV
jgi:protein-S-isoprenylcysteine O-methyltransferase Ste14